MNSEPEFFDDPDLDPHGGLRGFDADSHVIECPICRQFIVEGDRYHGTDWGAMGYEGPRGGGEPRCDSCKQPWRVGKALDALDELIRAKADTTGGQQP